jgi:hypothetical protein
MCRARRKTGLLENFGTPLVRRCHDLAARGHEVGLQVAKPARETDHVSERRRPVAVDERTVILA